jgi:hypothetical protein
MIRTGHYHSPPRTRTDRIGKKVMIQGRVQEAAVSAGRFGVSGEVVLSTITRIAVNLWQFQLPFSCFIDVTLSFAWTVIRHPRHKSPIRTQNKIRDIAYFYPESVQSIGRDFPVRFVTMEEPVRRKPWSFKQRNGESRPVESNRECFPGQPLCSVLSERSPNRVDVFGVLGD